MKEPEEEEDEIVEDSEGEQKPPEAMEQAEEPRTSLSTAEADQTAPALQTEQSRIDEELSHVPKTITCSRIHNDVDEVELLSDFYHKFLSNACRFSDDVNAHTTHLIMMNSEGRSIPQKSTAYLHAIARKCIIVGRQWLVDCLKTGLILSEVTFNDEMESMGEALTLFSAQQYVLSPPPLIEIPPIGGSSGIYLKYMGVSISAKPRGSSASAATIGDMKSCLGCGSVESLTTQDWQDEKRNGTYRFGMLVCTSCTRGACSFDNGHPLLTISYKLVAVSDF
ncbi:unnamed protein product [Caenorhabditis sp. 36 PRJEB53466]|nr:unnamed protein product [Caenorhabditis sp. 36 PRJEB53466]